jgi:ABC-type antimicrobial peptide transport system permease subunit
VGDAPVRAIAASGTRWDGQRMTRTLAGVALALALVVSACGGESKEDRAQKKVCAARADIKQQVDELKSTTISTATLDGVQANLQAIGKSLSQIATAQKDLKGDRKQDIQAATQSFKSAVTSVGRNLITSISAADAKQQIQTALQGLATSYQKALAPIDCSE